MEPDVLIIGGGPAGTTAGALLARKGYEVTLLEKTKHPRFHIGESLLPMNMPILESLGVLDQVKEIGVPKMGADFTYGAKTHQYRTYRFSRALGDTPTMAYEVKREEFDHILFRSCQNAGVTTHEQTTVREVQLTEGKPQVTSVDVDGNQRIWMPKIVIDASGRDAFMASQQGWKEKNPKHASAAVFGHFKGVKRRPGQDEGNISVYWHENGWMWMIPLKDDVMSIGAVCWPDYLKTRKTDLQQFLIDTIHSCPAAGSRMLNSELISKVGVASNYSYGSRQCWSDGFISIGDAYTFIDPVFSSGVYLAMSSAQRAVPSVENWLAGDVTAFRRSCKKYVRDTNRGLKGFSWFIYRFTSPAMRNLFNNPRNFFQVEDAVISMLSGDVFANKRVDRRLIVFKLIYAVSWLRCLKESVRSARRRHSVAKIRVSENLEAT